MHVHRHHKKNRNLPAEIVGWIGMVATFAAFVLLSAAYLTGDDWRFYALNAVGSIGMAINARVHDAKPSLILNLIFIGVALFGLYRVIS